MSRGGRPGKVVVHAGAGYAIGLGRYCILSHPLYDIAFLLIDGSGYTESTRLMSRGIDSINGKMTLLRGVAMKAGALTWLTGAPSTPFQLRLILPIHAARGKSSFLRETQVSQHHTIRVCHQ